MPAPTSFQRWLFRLARDQQIPIVLGQLRIFIVPTCDSCVFVGVLVLLMLGTSNANLGL